jgi:hypothetical protein
LRASHNLDRSWQYLHVSQGTASVTTIEQSSLESECWEVMPRCGFVVAQRLPDFLDRDRQRLPHLDLETKGMSRQT